MPIKLDNKEKETLKFLEEFFRKNFAIKNVKVGNLKLENQWRLISKEYYTDPTPGLHWGGMLHGLRDSVKDKTLRRRIGRLFIKKMREEVK